MIYSKVLIMVMTICFVSMSNGDATDPHSTGTIDSTWSDARATSYGDIHGGGTEQGTCGYDDPIKQGYGVATAALSMALFNDGFICGACYEIMCANDKQRCLPGTIKITATNLCPPDESKSISTLCNPPNKHFELSLPMFLKIAKDKGGVVPIKYRRVPCTKIGGVKFEIRDDPNHFLVMPYNIGGVGDIKAMQIKGNMTGWLTMTKPWGENWTTEVELFGQGLSFRITTSDGITKDFMNVAPPNWFYGQTFDTKINF